MKLTRLLAYGAAGIITGLLVENKALIFKQDARAAGGRAKKKLEKLARKVHG